MLIDNAYVSGMKEDLNLGGNDLSHLQSALLIGNCIGQVPGAYFFPKVPLHILIPGLDLGWGIFNLLQYRAKGLPELIAYRFFIGLFEVSKISSACCQFTNSPKLVEPLLHCSPLYFRILV